MVRAAEADKLLGPGSTIVEATSGNTGISLAMIAAVRGYRCVLVMPEDMSLERRYVLRSYGAEIVLTQALDGMGGAVSKALEIVEQTPGAFMPSQFDNPANPESHATGTAIEILEQTEGKISAFVAGVGTGGTITGVARVLRRELPGVKVIGVEPHASAVLSGKPPGMHGIQGLGAGFVPDILDRSLIDEILTVTDVAGAWLAS
jgi:cysteine synthase A